MTSFQEHVNHNYNKILTKLSLLETTKGKKNVLGNKEKILYQKKELPAYL